MMKSRLIAAVVLLALIVASNCSADVVLLSDDFNAENGGTAQTSYDSFANWNVIRGNVDLIGNGNFDFFPGNGLYVDSDGTNASAPGLMESKTTFDLLTSEMYTLSFRLANTDDRFGGTENPNRLTVSIGSFAETFTRIGLQDFESITRTFQVSADMMGQTISFDQLGASDAIGVLIDDVQFSCDTCVVPEPSSVFLLGLVLTSGVLCRRESRLLAN